MSRLGALSEASQAQALSDLPTLFKGDLATLGSWQFDESSARKIHQPALAVLGSDSAPFFVESIRALEDWLPATESFTLGGASHFLQMTKPSEMGAGLGSFRQAIRSETDTTRRAPHTPGLRAIDHSRARKTPRRGNLRRGPVPRWRRRRS